MVEMCARLRWYITARASFMWALNPRFFIFVLLIFLSQVCCKGGPSSKAVCLAALARHETMQGIALISVPKYPKIFLRLLRSNDALVYLMTINTASPPNRQFL